MASVYLELFRDQRLFICQMLIHWSTETNTEVEREIINQVYCNFEDDPSKIVLFPVCAPCQATVAHLSISLDCDGTDRFPKKWTACPVPPKPDYHL